MIRPNVFPNILDTLAPEIETIRGRVARVIAVLVEMDHRPIPVCHYLYGFWRDDVVFVPARADHNYD